MARLEVPMLQLAALRKLVGRVALLHPLRPLSRSSEGLPLCPPLEQGYRLTQLRKFLTDGGPFISSPRVNGEPE
eukprot:10629522-Prorocentrum_lima.AAC.1